MRRRIGLYPPQHRLHPGQELTGIERLGQVIVGPKLQAYDPVHVITPGRQHDHRDGMTAAYLLEHLKPVLSRHHDIKDDDVGHIFGNGFHDLHTAQ